MVASRATMREITANVIITASSLLPGFQSPSSLSSPASSMVISSSDISPPSPRAAKFTELAMGISLCCLSRPGKTGSGGFENDFNRESARGRP
jgi:hypothetical protein